MNPPRSGEVVDACSATACRGSYDADMSSLRSRAATRVVSALGVRKRLQLLADTYGDDEFEELLHKTRRQDKRQPPSRMRRGWDHSVVEIDAHALHLFAGDPTARRPAILYLHGGGYMFGPFSPEWKLAEEVAAATDSDLGVFLYPRAPEHTALQTVAATTRALAHLSEWTETAGVTLMGASAGGGLAVAIASDPEVRAESLVTSLALVSPAVDMNLTEATTEPQARDVFLSPDFVRLAGKLYAGELGIDHPWVSPSNGDLAGLPPIQLYAGEFEILLPSIRAFAADASSAGAKTHLVIGADQQHTYPTAPTPEGKEARTSIASFVRANR